MREALLAYMEKIKSTLWFAGKVWIALAVLSIVGKLVSKASPQLGAWVTSPTLIGDQFLS